MKKALCAFLGLSLMLAVSACAPASGTPSTPTATSGATPANTGSATQKATGTPTEAGGTMYSSYANLVAFDPATGVAKFDYFEMLKGDEAVDYLVEHEGYSEAEAQAQVDDFADSEFVKKNLSSDLRAIDIDDVSLKLMYQPTGTQVEGAENIPATASDFRAVYALDPSLLLDSFFFYIHADASGKVTLVEQVYWP